MSEQELEAGQTDVEGSEEQAAENGDISPEHAALIEEMAEKEDQFKNDLLLVKADMENLRRRQSRDLENAHKHAVDKFVAELLPICDGIEMGHAAAQADGVTLETMKEGMDMTLKMLRSSIGKFGLEQVDPTGEAFNPEWHEAISMLPADDVESNQVLNVVQKGYLINGRLLRPAMVVVSQ
jgi:molecular chaperone GrpE